MTTHLVGKPNDHPHPLVCVTKVRHSTLRDALLVLVRERAALPEGERLVAYRCGQCGGWHLGKKRDTH